MSTRFIRDHISSRPKAAYQSSFNDAEKAASEIARHKANALWHVEHGQFEQASVELSICARLQAQMTLQLAKHNQAMQSEAEREANRKASLPKSRSIVKIRRYKTWSEK